MNKGKMSVRKAEIPICLVIRRGCERRWLRIFQQMRKRKILGKSLSASGKRRKKRNGKKRKRVEERAAERHLLGKK